MNWIKQNKATFSAIIVAIVLVITLGGLTIFGKGKERVTAPVAPPVAPVIATAPATPVADTPVVAAQKQLKKVFKVDATVRKYEVMGLASPVVAVPVPKLTVPVPKLSSVETKRPAPLAPRDGAPKASSTPAPAPAPRRGIVGVAYNPPPMADPGMASAFNDCPAGSSCGQAMGVVKYVGAAAAIGLGLSQSGWGGGSGSGHLGTPGPHPPAPPPVPSGAHPGVPLVP